MVKIIVIARNVFKEAIRDKILYNLVFFSIALILFSLVLGEWSLFSHEKVIKDFTLATMSIMNLLLAVFIGVNLVQKEIQRKTIFTLLTKPIPRWYVIAGKYLGLLAVLALNLIIMTGVFYVLLWVLNARMEANLITAIYFIFLEMALILSVAFLFSSFSTPVLSALFTIGMYIGGHLTGDMHHHLQMVEKYGDRVPGAFTLSPVMKGLIEIFHWIIPNLEHFNIKGPVVHGMIIPNGHVIWVTFYAILFIMIFLGVASLWFSKRDFV